MTLAQLMKECGYTQNELVMLMRSCTLQRVSEWYQNAELSGDVEGMEHYSAIYAMVNSVVSGRVTDKKSK